MRSHTKLWLGVVVLVYAALGTDVWQRLSYALSHGGRALP